MAEGNVIRTCARLFWSLSLQLVTTLASLISVGAEVVCLSDFLGEVFLVDGSGLFLPGVCAAKWEQ